MNKLLIPNTTPIPNVLLDAVFPKLKPAPLRILLTIVRLTYGWQKTSDRISYSQLQKLTGLSRWAVNEGLKELAGLIEIVPGAKGRGANEYSLKVNISTGELARKDDQLGNLTSQVGSHISRPSQTKSKASIQQPLKDGVCPTIDGNHKKNKAPASTRHSGTKCAIDTYHDLFVAKFGAKPDIVGGRDGAILSDLLKAHGADEVQALLHLFFHRPPTWVEKANKFTVPAFKSAYNELLAQSGNCNSQMREFG